jgi:predicted negative regulator of RcsB-dependent stress response
MDEVTASLLQTLVQIPVVGLAFWFGWRIYLNDQKRTDYLIGVIVSMCADVTAQDVRDALKE